MHNPQRNLVSFNFYAREACAIVAAIVAAIVVEARQQAGRPGVGAMINQTGNPQRGKYQ
jgi:hypothetical protein